MKKKTKIMCILLMIAAILFLIGLLTILIIDQIVTLNTGYKIYSEDNTREIAEKGDFDCILVLGCGVRDGKPSHMLEDRLKVGISLYESGAAPKLLMSGDHGREEYDEVGVMREFAIAAGVPSEDVFMDHAGFSTYESIVRAKEIFGAEKILIVSQEYHLYRAIYIANSFDIEAYGVSADLREYRGMSMNSLRELLSRNKDFVFTKIKPKPTYLGDKVSLDGDGNVTAD